MDFSTKSTGQFLPSCTSNPSSCSYSFKRDILSWRFRINSASALSLPLTRSMIANCQERPGSSTSITTEVADPDWSIAFSNAFLLVKSQYFFKLSIVEISCLENCGHHRWRKYQEQVRNWRYNRFLCCTISCRRYIFLHTVERAHVSATWSVTWGGGKGPLGNTIVTGSSGEKVKCWFAFTCLMVLCPRSYL